LRRCVVRLIVRRKAASARWLFCALLDNIAVELALDGTHSSSRMLGPPILCRDVVALVPMGNLPWVTFVLLLLHIAEERAFGFPAWATAHFGTTTPGFYALSHIPLVAAAAHVARQATRHDASAGWLAASIMVQAALAANGIFHIASTLLFRQYSPGLITSVGLYVPFTIYFLRRASRDRRIRPAHIVMACAVGASVAVLLTASLALDMDFV
jgi:uncharacterized protein with HXXEE motif